MDDRQDDSPWKPPPDGHQQRGAIPSTRSTPLPTLPTLPPAPTLPPVAPPAPLAPPAFAPPAFDASPFDDGPAVVQIPPLASPMSGDDAVVVSAAASPARSRRSRWLVGGAAAAVVAIGLAGVFAVENLSGADQGGAASPDELGLALLQAVEDEDVLGVVDVLSPGERDVFRDPLVDLVAELTRLEILSTDADLSRILGVDVEFTNEAVTATSTNVADITNIDLRADATVTVDGSRLPIGDLITDNLGDDMLTEMRGTRRTETDQLDVRLTAVEQDGRWYFSVFHTIAELARDDMAPGTLIPVEGIGSAGADTPQAAFDGWLERVEALDLTGLLQTLNPGEAAALQRYAPLFLDDAEAIIDEAPLEWEITRREFRVDESGDTATVYVDALAIDGAVDGGTFSFEFADGCVRAAADGESFEQCENAAFEDVSGVLAEAPEIERLLETVTAAFSDIDEVGLEMRRTDGAWYVSPTTTLTEGLLAVLRALDRGELDAIIDQVPPAVEEFGDAIFGSWSDLPDDFDEFDDLSSGAGDEPPPLQPDGATSAWEECYSESDPAVATGCFQAAVDRGEIDNDLVPIVLRHPECGYQGAWGGGLYSLSDEDFTAAAEAAQPCFLDLVEGGEVSEYELPTEITHLECYEGRNWYTVFDDSAYDDRYYACISK